MRMPGTSGFQKLMKEPLRAVGALYERRVLAKDFGGRSPRKPSGQEPPLQDERGVALILTLAIITLVTLLMIAFAVSMRVENAASKNFNDLLKTRELAQGAIDQAVAAIRNATPLRTASPLVTYVTAPDGAVTNNNGVTTAVQLFSAPTSSDTTNLNAGFWITGQNPVEFPPSIPPTINVGWIYVAEDGTTGIGPLGKPLVGRFAFWVDDEASKININTAYQRPATSPDPLGYSTNIEVDLNMLLPGLNAFVPAIQTRQLGALSPGPGYSTIEEVKLADGNPYPGADTPDSDFNTNRFYLTTYSNDAYYPNYTDDRDVFDRQRKIISSLTNPGDLDNTPLVDSAYNRLADPALMKVCSSGPAVPAFENKYTVNGLKQIIANIIAYQIDPTTTAPPDGGGDPPPYLGLAKTPYVNEVKVTYSHNVAAGTVTRLTEVELFYPYGTDGSSYTAGGETIVVKNLPAFLGFSTGPITVSVNAGDTFSGVPTSGSAYRKYSFTDPPIAIVTPSGSAPAQTIIANYFRGANRLDCAQVPLPASGVIAAGTTVWQGAQANDPCVNENTTDWTGYSDPSIGSLGGVNTGVYSPLETPPSKELMRGDKMKSIGELGYIHTPKAWTYLRLQPQLPAEKPAIPDWAMLDIFAVGGGTAGRININSIISSITGPRRLVPLKALFNNVVAAPATVAQNIYDLKYVNSDTFGNTAAYDTIGELCEVLGMDNGMTLEADREAAIRRVANIITVRSNTFTIWVLAQGIKEPNITGQNFGRFEANDLITGDVKAQAVVERYEDTSTTPAKVKFRTRYFRYLYK